MNKGKPKGKRRNQEPSRLRKLAPIIAGLILGIIMVYMAYSTPPASAAPNYTISVYSNMTVVQEGYFSLIWANVAGGVPEGNLTFTVDGAAFQWSESMSRYEAKVFKGTMGAETYNTLDSFVDTGEPAAAAVLANSITVTWTQTPLQDVVTYAATGDFLGMLFAISYAELGMTITVTVFIAAISLAIFNFSGPEPMLLWWILSWSTFSVLVTGAAQGLGVIILSLGLALMIAKILMDRRSAG